MRRRKDYNDLTFTDDFMFVKVMQNKKLCKKLLEIILGLKIKDIFYPIGQKSIDNAYDSKSIRLDVYVDDDAGTVYDIEMQTTNPNNIPKRTRYYQGMIDLHLIEKGENYNQLRKSYVIFICTMDIFGKDKPVYRFENYCSDYNFPLGDESYKVILNASSSELKNSELDEFLRFVHTGKADNDFTQKLLNEVSIAKLNEEWRDEYMTLLMRDKQNKAEGVLLLQELWKVIPSNSEDFDKLKEASIEELEDLAEKYGVSEDLS